LVQTAAKFSSPPDVLERHVSFGLLELIPVRQEYCSGGQLGAAPPQGGSEP
jgi:hypothetical protein